ncbi:hypothetical protein JMJ55_21735 [Belnapia sp. T6]|uniref:Uncharacterized protein n=1 Tax=Belnapia mucosa TaxID=2804532 RepID=A0ABS1V8H2_9PROT|nr:hypothetical protein [Belnapia mucosa]MBL6457960.1 hypothetical protein [Belnapia mucosa]
MRHRCELSFGGEHAIGRFKPEYWDNPFGIEGRVMKHSAKRLLCIGAPILTLGMAALFGQSGYRAFTATFGLPLAAQLKTISDGINAEAPKPIDGTTMLLRTYVEGNTIVYRYALASPIEGNHRSYAQRQKQAKFSTACELLGQFETTDADADPRVAHQYVDSAGTYVSWTLDAKECAAQRKGNSASADSGTGAG